MISLELPYPPSVNHYWVHTKRGTFISEKGLLYRIAVKDVLAVSGIKKPLTGWLEISIKLYAPDRRKRDIDNGLKCLLDAFQKCGLVEDDHQFKRLTIERMDILEGCIEVYIKHYEVNL